MNMRAFVLTRYSGPDAMELRDVPRPSLGPGEVLIHVYAAGLNPIDFKMRQGMLRVIYRYPLPIIVGSSRSPLPVGVSGYLDAPVVGSRPDRAHPPGRQCPQLALTSADSPGIVFQVKNTGQVVEALAFARARAQLPLSIRSGGYGLSGRSTNDGGIVIDLSRMNKIEVLNRSTRRVSIEPGARWMDVAATLAPYSWALSSGDYGGVGVGGLAREHGLTIDHLRAVEMVLSDGSVMHASDEDHPDLFWAVRGAGANFGIITSFEFEVDEVGWAQLIFDASETADFLVKWGAAIEASPRDLTAALIIPPRREQPMIAYVMALIDSDRPDTIVNRLRSITALAPVYDVDAAILMPRPTGTARRTFPCLRLVPVMSA